MTNANKPDTSSAITAAIRAKREPRSKVLSDLDELEASLVADIESFDLAAAQRRAHEEQVTPQRGHGAAPSSFPAIQPEGARPPVRTPAPALQPQAKPAAAPPPVAGPSLLDQLRQEVAAKQQTENVVGIQRNATNEAIDRGLRETFQYLHDLVQQLNILGPEISRPYYLLDTGEEINQLSWHKGFADYRTQPEREGGLTELVTFSYRLVSPRRIALERTGYGIERLRNGLFDFGLPFDCQEIKNERQQVEKACFAITGEIAVNTRWQADFSRGVVVLEIRNLERLGNAQFTLPVASLCRPMLDEFGRLVLNQPSRFREYLKR